jgi:adenylate cyclase
MVGTKVTLREALTEITRAERETKLPERVVQAIRRQDNSSEILVKIIQLFVVSTLGILYLVSPKTDADTAFSPVPYALGTYLVLNLIGLVWAIRAGLPSWAVFLSIMFDMALLMVLIWSFHIQYEQPPSFYLKAPTLLYIFIFIALRALRFEARFVVAAGLIGAAGWLAMVLYVISANPFDTMITRDYITYMTSNSILLGAEFDKIVSILIVTGILALALRRAHILLVRAVTEQTAAHDLSRFFDESVATQIRGSDQEIAAGEGVNRDAAVLNIDIRGFTTMAAEMDAGEVMSLLTEYQRHLVPIIQRNGGTIDKFMGDGIMATFGASSASDTYAADSLRAVDAIIAEVDSWPQAEASGLLKSLRINLAVAEGPVAFGAIGDDKRLEYTVIGAAVNLSAKLEKHNKELGSRSVTTRSCYETAIEQGYERPVEATPAESNVHGTEGSQDLVVLHY